jgi:hypothetical protein
VKPTACRTHGTQSVELFGSLRAHYKLVRSMAFSLHA